MLNILFCVFLSTRPNSRLTREPAVTAGWGRYALATTGGRPQGGGWDSEILPRAGERSRGGAPTAPLGIAHARGRLRLCMLGLVLLMPALGIANVLMVRRHQHNRLKRVALVWSLCALTATNAL